MRSGAAAAEVPVEIRCWSDAERWCDDVLAGRVVAGELVRLAVQRHRDDLEHAAERGLWFDVEAADARLEFCSASAHVEDSLTTSARETFVPLPWQCFVLGSVHGWRREDGSRRFTLGYVEVGKKNGKTFLLGNEGLWLTGYDGTEGARVYSIATKEDQARLSWSPAERMLRVSPELRTVFGSNRKRIFDEESGSYWEYLGRDSDTSDGINPSALFVDELHRHRDGALYTMCRNSMVSRRNPITWIITTAGSGRESFCWSIRAQCENVVRGITPDDTAFVFIACLDPADDWKDEALWPKANPSLGVTKSLEFLRAERDKAVKNPRLENDFRRFHGGEWTEQVTRWLSIERWDACSEVRAGDLDQALAWRNEMLSQLSGERCYVGLDVGRTTDLCAAVALFPPAHGRDKYVAIPQFWLPESKLDPDSGEGDRVPYKVWAGLGLVEVIEGDAMTADEMFPGVRAFASQFKVAEFAYDPACAALDLAMKLQTAGFPMLSFSQGWATISPAAKQLEQMIAKGSLDHGGNPVLRWNASNVAVRVSDQENLRPTKGKSYGRIDGITALIMALGRAVLGGSVRRGVVVGAL